MKHTLLFSLLVYISRSAQIHTNTSTFQNASQPENVTQDNSTNPNSTSTVTYLDIRKEKGAIRKYLEQKLGNKWKLLADSKVTKTPSMPVIQMNEMITLDERMRSLKEDETEAMSSVIDANSLPTGVQLLNYIKKKPDNRRAPFLENDQPVRYRSEGGKEVLLCPCDKKQPMSLHDILGRLQKETINIQEEQRDVIAQILTDNVNRETNEFGNGNADKIVNLDEIRRANMILDRYSQQMCNTKLQGANAKQNEMNKILCAKHFRNEMKNRIKRKTETLEFAESEFQNDEVFPRIENFLKPVISNKGPMQSHTAEAVVSEMPDASSSTEINASLETKITPVETVIPENNRVSIPDAAETSNAADESDDAQKTTEESVDAEQSTSDNLSETAAPPISETLAALETPVAPQYSTTTAIPVEKTSGQTPEKPVDLEESVAPQESDISEAPAGPKSSTSPEEVYAAEDSDDPDNFDATELFETTEMIDATEKFTTIFTTEEPAASEQDLYHSLSTTSGSSDAPAIMEGKYIKQLLGLLSSNQDPLGTREGKTKPTLKSSTTRVWEDSAMHEAVSKPDLKEYSNMTLENTTTIENDEVVPVEIHLEISDDGQVKSNVSNEETVTNKELVGKMIPTVKVETQRNPDSLIDLSPSTSSLSGDVKESDALTVKSVVQETPKPLSENHVKSPKFRLKVKPKNKPEKTIEVEIIPKVLSNDVLINNISDVEILYPDEEEPTRFDDEEGDMRPTLEKIFIPLLTNDSNPMRPTIEKITLLKTKKPSTTTESRLENSKSSEFDMTNVKNEAPPQNQSSNSRTSLKLYAKLESTLSENDEIENYGFETIPQNGDFGDVGDLDQQTTVATPDQITASSFRKVNEDLVIVTQLSTKSKKTASKDSTKLHNIDSFYDNITSILRTVSSMTFTDQQKLNNTVDHFLKNMKAPSLFESYNPKLNLTKREALDLMRSISYATILKGWKNFEETDKPTFYKDGPSVSKMLEMYLNKAKPEFTKKNFAVSSTGDFVEIESMDQRKKKIRLNSMNDTEDSYNVTIINETERLDKVLKKLYNATESKNLLNSEHIVKDLKTKKEEMETATKSNFLVIFLDLEPSCLKVSCVGTFIRVDWIITSYVCVRCMKKDSVRVPVWANPRKQTHVRYKIKKIITHPSYSTYYDACKHDFDDMVDDTAAMHSFTFNDLGLIHVEDVQLSYDFPNLSQSKLLESSCETFNSENLNHFTKISSLLTCDQTKKLYEFCHVTIPNICHNYILTKTDSSLEFPTGVPLLCGNEICGVLSMTSLRTSNQKIDLWTRPQIKWTTKTINEEMTRIIKEETRGKFVRQSREKPPALMSADHTNRKSESNHYPAFITHLLIVVLHC